MSFLQQDAFADIDSYSSYEKQATLLSLILYYNELCKDALSKGVEDTQPLFDIPVREQIGRAKSVPPSEYEEKFRTFATEMEQQIGDITKGGDEA